MTCILLTSPITPISNSAYSHRSAQAEIYAQMIYDTWHTEEDPCEVVINYGNKIQDYSKFDQIYVYHGNDWSGALNLFGGLTGLSDPHGVVELFKFPQNKVNSIGMEMPDYPGLLRKRLKPGQTFAEAGVPILDQLPESVDLHDFTVTDVTFEPGFKTVVGDSHAIALYRPGWNVISVPFKTLHGALTGPGGLRALMEDKAGQFAGIWKHLEFYFGAIDIRHHLCRQDNPETAAVDLAQRYYDAVSTEFPDAETIKIYEPLPLENESRKLPKTGYYKGTPFYGTWAERNNVRTIFVNSLEQLCANSPIEFVRWTGYLTNASGELDFQHMEKPRSVHLARASYPFWQGHVTLPPANQHTGSLENFFD